MNQIAAHLQTLSICFNCILMLCLKRYKVMALLEFLRDVES